MRRLIVMRHAKSSWADAGQRDFDRPLNKRGRNASKLIGRWLKAGGHVPDLALVSSARRAQETWSGVVAETGPADTQYLPELYHAGPDTMLDVVRRAADVGCLLLLGHQPGIGAFLRRLLAEAPTTKEFEKFPTGATALVDLDVESWRDAGWGGGRLAEMVVPRALE